MRLLISILLVSFVFLQDSWGQRGPIFKSKTDDLTVNDKCEEYKPSFFLQSEIKYFLVGIRGTKRAGFHEEVNITRDNARLLWHALNPHTKPGKRSAVMNKVNNSEALSRHYDTLLEGREERGAEYYSEGEILEILSYEALPESESFNQLLEKHFGRDDYSREDFFITGGVTYHTKSGQTVGELDVVVGDSKTCTVFGIGEAKLGGKKSKAVRQLDRIKQFLRSL